MRSTALLLLLVSLVTPAATAAEKGKVSDTLFRAMTDEMKRTVERLDVADLGKPYFVSFTARDTRRLAIESTLGALKDPHEIQARTLKVDLRVGSAKFDNTHYVGAGYWSNEPEARELVRDDDYDALRYGIWSVCDELYKNALDTLAKKKAYRQSKLIKESIPDLSKEPVVSSVTRPVALAFDRALWEKQARKLSAVFKRYPPIQMSRAKLYWSQRHTHFVDSEGRKTLKPDHDFEITIEASTQAKDGRKLAGKRRFVRRSLANMPPLAELEAAAASLAEDVTALAKAPLWEGIYVGPVLFEEQAAGEFFLQLLARNASFSRAPWAEEKYYEKYFHSGSFAGRLGLRVVSPILSVADDPSLKAFEGTPLAGHYKVDDEGIPAQRVLLIEKGILKNVLMSRSPIKDRKHSNGHGRAGHEELPAARIGNLIISSNKTAPPAGMKKELLRRAVDYGLTYGVIVRRMAGEEEREDGALLSAPVLVYRVHVKDGREELVRNAEFTGVTLRALRDVAVTSRKRHVYNTYQLGRARWNPGKVPASIVHPSIIVAEMELTGSGKKPDRLPYLERPRSD